MNKNTIIAIFYIVFGANIICLSDLVMRNLAVVEDLSGIQVAFYRTVAMLVLFIPLLKIKKLSAFPKLHSKKIQLTRGLFYGVTIASIQVAFIHIPMAQAIVIFAISPISAVIMAQFVLGEKVGVIRYSAVVFGFLGVFIVINPTEIEKINIGHISAFIAGLSNGVYIITSRKLKNDLAPLQQTYISQSLALIPIVFLLLFVFEPIKPAHILPSMLGAGIALITHWTFMIAMKMESASLLSPFLYTQVIGMTLTGYYGLGQIPTTNVFIGSAIVITAGVIIAYREYKLNKLK